MSLAIDAMSQPVAPWRRLADTVLSSDPRQRIRIAQWLISALVYFATTGVLWFGALQGVQQVERLLFWSGAVALGQAAFYVALRSGWSERFKDPALTTAQIVFGVTIVDWGYLICGPIRTLALLPLLLIFAFGAFSLSWRRIMQLTALALASLIATVTALNLSRAHATTWNFNDIELRIDVTNLLMILILLPALSLVAARLSALRSKLRAQREALSEALEEVERLATHDELTGLSNRRHAQAQLVREQHRFERSKVPFSIAIIDLDKFKSINDRLGHAGGDDVLRAFSAAAVHALRACDLLARWGGEEFLVLLPGATGEQAQATVERVLEHVRSLPHTDAPLSFSAGVAEYQEEESIADLVSRADACMYLAKLGGRNQVLLAGADSTPGLVDNAERPSD